MEEGQVNREQKFVADQYASELTEPDVGSLDLPAVFVSSSLVVLPVMSDQLDASPFPLPPQRVGIITVIGDHSLPLLPRSAYAPTDADLSKRGVRKLNFFRRGTFRPSSQRNTFTVSQSHSLCAFTTLGFVDRIAPFFRCCEAAV
jgi:hypothetical protein